MIWPFWLSLLHLYPWGDTKPVIALSIFLVDLNGDINLKYYPISMKFSTDCKGFLAKFFSNVHDFKKLSKIL